MLLLTAKNIRQAITMRETIDVVREGYIALSKGTVIVPLRGVMQAEQGLTLTMPANLDTLTTVKIVSVFSGNPARGLPTIHSMVVALDGETGKPLALLDGASLTALRTGAGSGVATEILARQDAAVLGVIGSGVQARTQIEAVCTVRDIREIRIYSPNRTQQLVDAIQGEYTARVIASPTREAALAGADVIVAATNSKTPVVLGSDLKRGVQVNGVGSFTPQMQEVSVDVIQRAKVIVDHRESVWEEAGDFIIPRNQGLFSDSDIFAEIGEVAAEKKPGRESDSEIIFFKSVGNAVQDVVTAQRIIANAQARGIGVEFDFS